VKPKRDGDSSKSSTGYTKRSHASSGALKDSAQRAGHLARGFGRKVGKQEHRVSKARGKLDSLYRQKALIPRSATAKTKERAAKQIKKQEQKLDREVVKLDQMQQQTGAVVTRFDAATDEMT